MKTLVKLSLTALTVSLLAACSGGSKGGDSTPAATQINAAQPSNQSQPATPQQPQTAQTPSSTAAVQGSGQYGDAFVNGKFVGVNSSADIPMKLVVEGKTITLRNAGIVSGGFSVNRGNVTINGVKQPAGVVSGLRYDTEFGYVDGVTFYQGKNPTTTLPQGVATYIGDAVYAKNGQFTTQRSSVNLNVDFNNKTLSGLLLAGENNNEYLGQIHEVRLQDGKITENGFSGTAVQGSESAELKGKFFGSSAAEIAGAYAGSSFSGAFGAKKQP